MVWVFAVDWIPLLRFATVVVAVVVVAVVAAGTVVSASCTEEFVADCFLMPWDLVHSADMTATFQPLDSSSFDRHTVADREAGIFADFLIEELAAKQRRTILLTGYYFSDIGSRNRKVAVRSVAGGWTVMFGTFGRIPVSSFPRGYRLIVLGYKRVCMLVSIPVSQGSPGLDLIDHRMRHCLKLEDENQVKVEIHCQVEEDYPGRDPTPHSRYYWG